MVQTLVSAYPLLMCIDLTGIDLSQFSSSEVIVSSFLLNSKVQLAYARWVTDSKQFPATRE